MTAQPQPLIIEPYRKRKELSSGLQEERVVSLNPLSDFELADLFNNRNSGLFTKMRRQLVGYAQYYLSLDKEESEDIVSDAFIELLSKKRSFEDLDHVFRWLKVVMKNALIDRLRLKNQWKHRCELEESQLVEESFLEQKARFEGELEKAKQFCQILHEIRTLKGRFRDVFYQYFIKNKSTTEIADYYNLSKQTVRNHKTHAIGVIKQRIQSLSEEFVTGRAIVVRSYRSKLVQICLDDILYIQSQGKNCMIFTQSGCHRGAPALEDIGGLLSTKEFIQIHTSFIVSRKWVSELSKYFVVVGGNELPVGFKFRKNLQELSSLINETESKKIDISEDRYRSSRLHYNNVLFVKGKNPHSIVATSEGEYV